jgi:hypothetical protein
MQQRCMRLTLRQSVQIEAAVDRFLAPSHTLLQAATKRREWRWPVF